MAGPDFLHGDRVRLRAVEATDVGFVRDVVNDPAVWRSIGGQTTPTNLEMEQRFFEEASRRDDTVQFVVLADAGAAPEAADDRVGLIELDPIEWEQSRAAVAFVVAPAAQGAGLARDALATVVSYAFVQLGLHKLTAEAYASNGASTGLLESVGFVEEGRLRDEEWSDGDWVDVVRFGVLAEEWDDG